MVHHTTIHVDEGQLLYKPRDHLRMASGFPPQWRSRNVTAELSIHAQCFNDSLLSRESGAYGPSILNSFTTCELENIFNTFDVIPALYILKLNTNTGTNISTQNSVQVCKHRKVHFKLYSDRRY